ncbi:PREDICTED: centromere protein T [Chaetura pelagica]|nr:PREDICTED: centromere protein T [Chaetura pelagica]
MLMRIIQTQPEVSPLAPLVFQNEEKEEAASELPSKRVLSMGEMQLSELVPENTSIARFHMTRKRKKLSVSEFERAADRRLPQQQAQPALDSTVLARSLRVSVGSLMPPDTVEKKGLLRRPRNRRAIDVEAFEGGVEQNMLKRKAQDYLVDSEAASGMQTAMLTNDAEVVLDSTELFVQPQVEEPNQNQLSAPEPQLLHSKTLEQRSKILDAAQKETGLAGLVSKAGTNEEGTQRHAEELILEHGGRMTLVSPGTPANQREDQQDHSQEDNPVEQLSSSEEAVDGTVNRWSSSVPPRRSSKYLRSPFPLKPERSFSMYLREVVSRIIEDLDVSETEEEMPNAVKELEQEEIFSQAAEHCANAGYSEHLEKELTKKAVSERSVEQVARVETEMAPSEEKGVAEGNVEHPGPPEAECQRDSVGAGSLGRNSHAVSSSEKSGMEPLEEDSEEAEELEHQPIMVELDDLQDPTEDESEDSASEDVSMKTPTFVRAAASKVPGSTARPAKPPAPRLSTPHPAKPAASKPPLRAKPVPQRKRNESGVASSLIKKIFSHYVKMPVTREAFKIVEKCSERYFKQLSDDLEVYAKHAGRKTVDMADMEVLMRRQKLVTEKMPLHVLIERFLPLEYRKLLIPVAVSGNKLIPGK